eukprot:scaffold68483_cov65-Phaeocystis_antarctica.AAC.1
MDVPICTPPPPTVVLKPSAAESVRRLPSPELRSASRPANDSAVTATLETVGPPAVRCGLLDLVGHEDGHREEQPASRINAAARRAAVGREPAPIGDGGGL